MGSDSNFYFGSSHCGIQEPKNPIGLTNTYTNFDLLKETKTESFTILPFFARTIPGETPHCLGTPRETPRPCPRPSRRASGSCGVTHHLPPSTHAAALGSRPGCAEAKRARKVR